MVYTRNLGLQALHRLRGIEGDFAGQEIDLLGPFDDITTVARDLRPEHPALLPNWIAYHQAFLLEQAFGMDALSAVQPARLCIEPSGSSLVLCCRSNKNRNLQMPINTRQPDRQPELTDEQKPKNPRSRLWCSLGVLAVIAFGLASRKFPFLFPAFLGKYPGDALWALMVFLGWAFLKPNGPTLRLAIFALATSYVIELSQLYQAPWINSLRSIPAVHLVLGSTFSWLDIIAYTIGIAIGITLDLLVDRRRL